MNTIENNKSIAQFMGLKIVGGHLQKYIDSNSEPKQYWEGKAKTFEHQIYGWQITHHKSKIQYHSDWNWLMEVVSKIYSLELDEELVLIVRDALADASLQGTYDACIDFIKWYNLQEGV